MPEPNIALLAALIVGVLLIGMFSKMLRVALVIAVIGAVIWAVQGGIGLEQGFAMLTELVDRVRALLSGIIDFDAATSLVREMLDRVTG